MIVSPGSKVVVVGAGVAGLTLAYKLSLAGIRVLVVEKEAEAGGLARSFCYGDYVFDIGPHRFHSDNPEVMTFVKHILDGNYLTIGRKSGVWMFDRYFEWPLDLAAAFGIPVSVLAATAKDLLLKKKNAGECFEDYIVSEYGETLYRIFFKPYTEKFLGMPCSDVSRDWAVTGIERAVIDKKVKADNLLSVLKSACSPAAPLKFIYPKDGGIAEFSRKLVRGIVDHGGTVLLNTEVTEIAKQGTVIRQVVIEKERHDCDLLVWTAPIPEILRLLENGQANLEYLSLLLYNYRINHTPLENYQWCYYGSNDVPFNRISIPSLFNPSLAPQGKAGVCVEITCRQDDDRWRSPLSAEPAIRQALLRTKVVRSEKDFLGFEVEKVANAYPVYSMDYKNKLADALKVTADFANLKLLGRSGTFWYNNMDHSIEAAFDVYGKITRDGASNFL